MFFCRKSALSTIIVLALYATSVLQADPLAKALRMSVNGRTIGDLLHLAHVDYLKIINNAQINQEKLNAAFQESKLRLDILGPNLTAATQALKWEHSTAIYALDLPADSIIKKLLLTLLALSCELTNHAMTTHPQTIQALVGIVSLLVLSLPERLTWTLQPQRQHNVLCLAAAVEMLFLLQQLTKLMVTAQKNLPTHTNGTPNEGFRQEAHAAIVTLIETNMLDDLLPMPSVFD